MVRLSLSRDLLLQESADPIRMKRSRENHFTTREEETNELVPKRSPYRHSRCRANVRSRLVSIVPTVRDCPSRAVNETLAPVASCPWLFGQVLYGTEHCTPRAPLTRISMTYKDEALSEKIAFIREERETDDLVQVLVKSSLPGVQGRRTIKLEFILLTARNLPSKSCQ